MLIFYLIFLISFCILQIYFYFYLFFFFFNFFTEILKNYEKFVEYTFFFLEELKEFFFSFYYFFPKIFYVIFLLFFILYLKKFKNYDINLKNLLVIFFKYLLLFFQRFFFFLYYIIFFLYFFIISFIIRFFLFYYFFFKLIDLNLNLKNSFFSYMYNNYISKSTLNLLIFKKFLIWLPFYEVKHLVYSSKNILNVLGKKNTINFLMIMDRSYYFKKLRRMSMTRLIRTFILQRMLFSFSRVKPHFSHPLPLFFFDQIVFLHVRSRVLLRKKYCLLLFYRKLFLYLLHKQIKNIPQTHQRYFSEKSLPFFKGFTRDSVLNKDLFISFFRKIFFFYTKTFWIKSFNIFFFYDIYQYWKKKKLSLSFFRLKLYVFFLKKFLKIKFFKFLRNFFYNYIWQEEDLFFFLEKDESLEIIF